MIRQDYYKERPSISASIIRVGPWGYMTLRRLVPLILFKRHPSKGSSVRLKGLPSGASIGPNTNRLPLKGY